MVDTREDVIRCEGIWKIFGDKSRQAMQAVRDKGLSKKEIREQFDCVVGVQDASFTVRRGEIFCIMGLSGSGRSTLIRHINRLIDPTAGEVLVDVQGQELDVVKMNAAELRRFRREQTAMVFQKFALFPHLTVLENAQYGLSIRGVAAKERLERARRWIARGPCSPPACAP